jgi:hypothetical protein
MDLSFRYSIQALLLYCIRLRILIDHDYSDRIDAALDPLLLFDSVDPDPEIINPNVGNVRDADEAGNRTAKEAGQKAQAATMAEVVDMVKQFQAEWGPHYAALQKEKLRKINELAAKSSYTISLQVESAKTFVNPLTGEEEPEME